MDLPHVHPIHIIISLCMDIIENCLISSLKIRVICHPFLIDIIRLLLGCKCILHPKIIYFIPRAKVIIWLIFPFILMKDPLCLLMGLVQRRIL